MDETVRYTYRLRPGATARATLLAEWGRCRWLWNEAVHQHKTGRRPTFGKLSKLLTGARARSSWLWEGSQVAQQQTLRTYALALQHSFRVKGRGGPSADGAIGVDWGVTTTATTTDPAYDLPYLGHRKRCAAELARLQRRMARRRRAKGVKPSNGYLRARRQAARVARRAARQNAHDARVWAKKVVDNHATIAIEDFKPTFLARSRMARKAADAAIGAAKRELINRGTRAGRKVVLVPPAYTTMTCSQCGTRAKHRLGLGVRVFRCDTCGHTACRDRNAARVILTMAERDRAGADDVRHAITSFRDGARVRSEPEIPRLPAMGRRYQTTSRAGIGKTSRPPQCRT
ncbi:transposase [Plantactinospora sp. ZYX-F-223]|uniref:transposase n=1 Tax=Plantactinospora sp. ZYX-F-223 TaxID=3144103 RepID=UPI0031FC67C3